MGRDIKRGPNTERSSRERLVALTLLGALLFNFPLLKLFGAEVLVFGVPLLFFYVFLVWAVFLWLVARVLSRQSAASADSGD